MSNAWIIREADSEYILDFVFSDPRFWVGPEEGGERQIRVNVGDKTYTVGTISMRKEGKWKIGCECGGPAPWRELAVVNCPINIHESSAVGMYAVA